ncbi:hypothetical protein EYF80_005736 [Liparis tanakae]|uniref:Uncharacterized protein n=1 Tax=Liparis tanakae TaxID=230148 RepID=A0A4Z2J0L1_9TELE|nr:hypothetical protein EYF80_005736 [Liparis tanakae]
MEKINGLCLSPALNLHLSAPLSLSLSHSPPSFTPKLSSSVVSAVVSGSTKTQLLTTVPWLLIDINAQAFCIQRRSRAL